MLASRVKFILADGLGLEFKVEGSVGEDDDS